MTEKPRQAARMLATIGLRLLAALVGLLLVMSTGWVADTVLDPGANLWLALTAPEILQAEGYQPASLWQRLILPAGLLLVSSVAFYFLGRELLPPRNLNSLSGNSVRPARTIVASLSFFKPGQPVGMREADNGDRYFCVEKAGALEEKLCPATLEAAVLANREDNVLGNWQQTLRLVAWHYQKHQVRNPGQLPAMKLVLICTSKAWPQFETVRQLLQSFMPGLSVERYPQQVGDQDMEALYTAYREAINDAKQQGVQEKDVMVDATGGTKTSSIVAAMVTLAHDDLRFQYINNYGDPEFFDAAIRNQPSFA